jgi:hypothetical protein
MKLHGITPILNVASVPQSIAWFERLGWQRGFSWNSGGIIEGGADCNEHGPAHFAGICSGKCEIFLCQGAQGSRGTAPSSLGDEDTGGVWMSWWVGSPEEVDEVHQLALANGYTISWPPTNEPWGVRECRICHPDGHTFRIGAGLSEGKD